MFDFIIKSCMIENQKTVHLIKKSTNGPLSQEAKILSKSFEIRKMSSHT